MRRQALTYADRRQEECMRQIRRIYGDALETALKKQKRFFKKIEDIESGKYKPPQYYVQRGTVKKWRQGFVREALRQEQVIQGIMNVLNKAGDEAATLMTPYMVDIYRYNRAETVRLITDGMGKEYGVTPNFAMYDPKQVRALLADTQPPFSKIAYKNMGKNLVVRNRLQSEFAQAVILGEGVKKMRQRVQKCTGQLIWQARRVARTEFTRVQAQARYETAKEAFEMGVNVYNEWTARMVNTRDTHAEMNGQKRMPGEPFESPSGALLMYPGDPSAPAAEVINCQCQITTRVMRPNERLVGGEVVQGLPSGEMYREPKNTGAFAELPERMSKKHIREVAKTMGIPIKGLSFVIDEDPEKLHPMFRYTGRADPERIGRIDFFPKAFLSLEELTRTLFHEKIHVEQFKLYGPEYVQNNRKRFEDEAEYAENEFIEKLRKEGKL